MRSFYRMAVGFGAGLVLSGCAFILTGAGHGTYAPTFANAPMLAIIPNGIGILLSLFGTPFLWGFYLLAIPKIGIRPLRWLTVAIVAAAHLGSGLLIMSREVYWTGSLQRYPSFMILYGGFLVGVLLTVTAMSYAPVSKSQRRVES